jgi:general secretion pathway protein A
VHRDCQPIAALTERPFGLTPDPRFFFKSRAHARAIETLTFALRRRERFLLVTGNAGTGKTMLCHALVEQLRRSGPVSLVSNPLITPGGLSRLLLNDLAASSDEPGLAPTGVTSPAELRERLLQLLATIHRRRGGPVIVVDEAHMAPTLVVEQLLALSEADAARQQPLQIVLVGRARPDGSGTIGIRALDQRVSTRTRLTPLTREECGYYVRYRLSVAGSREPGLFTPRAIDVLHGLSGGLPRLVSLLAERALQLAEAHGAAQIDSRDVAAVGSTLELVPGRPRRFRWFAARVS